MMDLNVLAGKYFSHFPATLKNGWIRWIGKEVEFPVVRENGQAFDVRKVFPHLQKEGWEPYYDDWYKEEMLGLKKDEINITTDAGYCTLEVNLPPLRDLWEVRDEFEKLMVFLCSTVEKYGGLILGYGIQPATPPDDSLWIKKKRHETVRLSYPPTINNVTVTAAQQVHIDITQAEIVQMTNVLNALSGLMIVLCANSPVWRNSLDREGRLAVREHLWHFSNGGRIGVPYECFVDVPHFLQYVTTLPFLVTKKEEEYCVPGKTFSEYLVTNGGLDTFDDHYLFHEGTFWPCARPRTLYGTIEVRPCCTQPPRDHMVADALALGAVENTAAIEEKIINHFPWEAWRNLREEAIFQGFAAKIEDEPILPLLKEFLDLVKKGLEQRGRGEEIFLAPLYQRLEEKKNPSNEAIALYERGGINALVQALAYRF